jgi:hypothetical protein
MALTFTAQEEGQCELTKVLTKKKMEKSLNGSKRQMM